MAGTVLSILLALSLNPGIIIFLSPLKEEELHK